MPGSQLESPLKKRQRDSQQRIFSQRTATERKLTVHWSELRAMCGSAHARQARKTDTSPAVRPHDAFRQRTQFCVLQGTSSFWVIPEESILFRYHRYSFDNSSRAQFYLWRWHEHDAPSIWRQGTLSDPWFLSALDDRLLLVNLI